MCGRKLLSSMSCMKPNWAAERIRYDVLLKEYADYEAKRLEKVICEKSKNITEMEKAGDETEY